jgi:hypothetical protein
MGLTPPYLSRRAQEEGARAEQASSAEARKAHLELAFRYEQLVVEHHLAGACSHGLPGPPPGDQQALGSFGRAELGRVIRSAFVLPTSGSFPDLLESIDGAELKVSRHETEAAMGGKPT